MPLCCSTRRTCQSPTIEHLGGCTSSHRARQAEPVGWNSDDRLHQHIRGDETGILGETIPILPMDRRVPSGDMPDRRCVRALASPRRRSAAPIIVLARAVDGVDGKKAALLQVEETERTVRRIAPHDGFIVTRLRPAICSLVSYWSDQNHGTAL